MIFSNSIPEAISKFSDSGLAIGIGDFRSEDLTISSNYRPDWQELYINNGWFKEDPVVINGLCNTGIMDWDSLPNRTSEVFITARDYGINGGVMISSNIGGNRCVAGISLTKKLNLNAKKEAEFELRRIHSQNLTCRAESLTQTQKDLVYLIANGLRAKQVAKVFEVSEDTIKQRKLTIQRKLGVNNFFVVVNICAQAGLTFHRIS